MSSIGSSREAISPQRVLFAALAVEILVFSGLGRNFLTVVNALEIARLSVEIGLLAIVMTPVIVTGGIDLSVGSLMGLVAVLFGKLWRDAGLPIEVAAALGLVAGSLAGALNGWLITRWRLPPLIVTLGSFSLFRGLAEGMTGGVDNFTRFPDRFLFLGQGYLPGGIPTQLPVLIAVALGMWWLFHRTAFGRSLMAIGYSPSGALHAGLPVDRRLMAVYTLSGVTSALAAIVYVAHLGQAKADAGTGYELMAITAVVLGGTSIFGGQGTIHGTILGLFAIALLQNGLQLSDLPRELAGVLTGLLLLGTISIHKWQTARPRGATPQSAAANQSGDSRTTTVGDHVGGHDLRDAEAEGLDMKNSQLAVLCAVILGAALIIAGSNRHLADSIRSEHGRSVAGGGSGHDSTGGGTGSNAASGPGGGTAILSGTTGSGGKPLTIAMMPKSKGNPYFIACQRGANEAAKELGVTLLWDGPTDPDPAKQNDVIDAWITRGVDVLAVAVENRQGISSVLRKARQKGIKVITWDADAEPDSREFFVNQATPEGIGQALLDTAAGIMNEQGEYAIITASLTASNMIAWQEQIAIRNAEKYPNMKLAVLRPCDDKQPKAFDEAKTIMNSYPNVKVILAICSPAAPGAAEAVKQAGRNDVKVIGISLPNNNKRYVHEGITPAVILWNTTDLGYLAVHAAVSLHRGTLKPGDSQYVGGRLGTLTIEKDNLLLGKPFLFTKDNIDQYDF